MDCIVIVDDYYNQEFDFWLYRDDVVSDSDIEPDLVAQLLSSSVLQRLDDEDDQGNDNDEQ